MLHHFAGSSQRQRLNKQGLLVKGHHQKHMKHLCLFKTRPHGAQATSGAHYAAEEDVFISCLSSQMLTLQIRAAIPSLGNSLFIK